MGEFQSQKQLFNPFILHLEKLSLELKCPLCLNLLECPNLLPCHHIFCNGCIKSWGSECPACKSQYTHGEIKPAPYMENIVTIYKCLTATSLNTLAQPISCDAGNNLNLCPVTVDTNSDGGAKMELYRATDGNSSSGTFLPLSPNNCGGDIVNAEGNKLVFNAEARLNHIQSRDENTNVKHKENVINEIDMNQTGQLSPGCTCLSGSPDDSSTDPWTSRDAKRHKSNSEDGNGVCVFCHSSDVSDETGKMLHYANGKEVVGDAKPIPNSMHVHQICIDWTPQVYYEGDNIRNLESELARASKLKCTECGLKGAGLGCYMKSCRRSYHVTCALKTSDCKWDFNDFIMMCPIHKAVKFPREKTKSRKAVEPLVAPIVPQQANFYAAPPSGAKEWVFCGSALSNPEMNSLLKFANSCGATVSKNWAPNVTHVIAAVDANGAYTRTRKVLMAILNGTWIVTTDWIKACNEANKLVDEEPYEAGLDKHGCRDGPKTGRYKALHKAPKLFSGLKFYFGADFTPKYKKVLVDFVTAGGGLVIDSKEVGAQSSITLVIYDDEIEEYIFAAEDLAQEFRCGARKHTWILECIASCKLIL